MAAIKCDICGGSLSMDASGDFALCDSCGMKHTKDRVKAMAQEVTGTVEVSNIAGIDSLMKRGNLCLEDSDWKQADEYFEKVLDISPEYALAYVGKLCAELRLQQEEQLGQSEKPLTEYNLYQKAMRFANIDYRAQLEGYNKTIQERIEHLEQENLKQLEEKRQTLTPIRKRNARFKMCISGKGRCGVIGLKVDGTVVMAGFEDYELGDNQVWRNIVAVSSGGAHIIGLKADGTVIANKFNEHGQGNIQNWRDIVMISTGATHAVGLKADGTVVAVGENDYGQCNTQGWRDIVAISAAPSQTVGLKLDGTIVTNQRRGTQNWCNIVAVCATGFGIIGLKSEGRVVVTESHSYYQNDTKYWQDIVDISYGDGYILGLKADGTVVASGEFCKYRKDLKNVKYWRNIVAIDAGDLFAIGLKADGTVVVSGDTSDILSFERDVEIWRGIGSGDKEQLFKQAQEEQRAKEQGKQLQREEEQRRIEQSKRWEQQGLCRHCGGQMGGLFTKKCKSCGRAN